MSTPVVNPFKFGDPVEGSYFLPRPELAKLVAQFLENRIHVVLIGPRRFGKTSFVLNLLKKLERRGHTCMFVDIFNITSHRDFLQQMLRALPVKKGLTLDRASEKDVKEMIQDLLASLDKLGKKVIVSIDEFQKISEIDDQGWLEATLRTHMQQLKNTAFLCTGSRKSIIYDMLNNRSRPFYRSCQSIEFPVFGQEFTTWIVDKFRAAGIECPAKVIQYLRVLVQDTPNYVQMVCFHLFTIPKKRITARDIDEVLATLVRQNSYTYQTLLTTLSPTQQRALRLAANEGSQIFAKELLSKYEITSGPALASALHALKQKRILDEEGTCKGAVVFDDPLLAIWIKSL